MPIHFIDNYPQNNLESVIRKEDGSPLYGELWFYQELQKFTDNHFLADETWFVKHSYNLSSHPSGARKVEGEIDYLILNKYGILLVEIKGGGIAVDGNDVYYSYSGQDRYEIENPFNQVKGYAHSLKRLIRSGPFIYRAVIFPHESGFELKGPQLIGYKHMFLCKKNFDGIETSFAKNKVLFEFLHHLPKHARRNLVVEMDPLIDRRRVDEKIWSFFPELNRSEINRLRSELFPTQTTYGFNPDKIKNDILLEENFEILNGLGRNRKVIVQGAPGTGKTVLATKFFAEALLRQQKGIFLCANKLLRSRMEHLAYAEYELDQNSLSFKIFFNEMKKENVGEDIDFIIVDEAQEFFDKGLYDFAVEMDREFHSPKWLILYDPDQAIMQDFKDIEVYASFFMDMNYAHYLFDTVWRGCQNKEIIELSDKIRNNKVKTILKDYSNRIRQVVTPVDKLGAIKNILVKVNFEHSKYVFLIHSDLLEDFCAFVHDFFSKEFVELTEANINVADQRMRYTTPIKYRGLECDNVILVTPCINEQTRTQNYVGVTRAIYELNILIWN
ncbi:MAG TPA: NERD domain-containing protein [Cyclobacteriaceae bacterium]|jgi:hypothetical protein|nr:NERD domain-containing protein [Cyclobacteriaceae bacterium]